LILGNLFVTVEDSDIISNVIKDYNSPFVDFVSPAKTVCLSSRIVL
jgi:hypothetical protein